jgi:hypothetical protein
VQVRPALDLSTRMFAQLPCEGEQGFLHERACFICSVSSGVSKKCNGE